MAGIERLAKADPERFEHGTRARYVTGCRCAPCTKSNRAVYYERQQRGLEAAAAIPAPPRFVPVGQEWTLTDGSKAVRVYKRACPGIWGAPCATSSHLRKDSKGGVCCNCRDRLGANPLVDARRAAEHIDLLSQMGVGYKQVADAAGVSETVVFEVRAGRKARIRRRTEFAILSVDDGATADRALVDAKPTRRRIRKMMRLGLTQTEIAERFACIATVHLIRTGKSKQVTLRTEAAVTKLAAEVLAEAAFLNLGGRCDDCETTHRRHERWRLIRRGVLARMPAAEIRAAWACMYGDGAAGARRFDRDLDAVRRGRGLPSDPRREG